MPTSLSLAYRRVAVWLLPLLISISMLSGDFSLSRLGVFPWRTVTDVPVKIIALGLSFFLILPIALSRGIRWRDVRENSAVAIAAFVGGLIYVGVAIQVCFFEFTERSQLLAIRCAVIAAGILVLSSACMFFGERLVKRIAGMVVLLSFLWALLFCLKMIVGSLSQESVPLGSPFSFYRTQFLAFFCGIFLLNRSDGVQRLCWGGLACICLTACFSSMSKAAWFGGVAAITVYAFAHLVWFSWKKAVLSCALFSLAAAISLFLVGSMLSQRVGVAFVGKGYTESFIDLVDSHSLINDNFFAERNKGAVMAYNLMHGNNAGELEKLQPGVRRVLDEFYERNIILPDLTCRLRLLREALVGGAGAIWFGKGFASFRYDSVNLYTKKPEVYRYPHNLMAETFYSSGLVGLGGLFLGVLLGLGGVLGKKRRLPFALPFVSAAIGILIGALLAGDITDFSMFWMILVLGSALVSPCAEKDSCGSEIKNSRQWVGKY